MKKLIISASTLCMVILASANFTTLMADEQSPEKPVISEASTEVLADKKVQDDIKKDIIEDDVIEPNHLDDTDSQNSRADTVTVTFELNGGQMSESSIEIPKNSTVDTSLYQPTKEGSLFFMWYTDADFETMYLGWDRITEDTILYARWGTEISRDEFSDDLLKILESNFGVSEPISDLELLDINTFDSSDFYYNPETDNYENISVYDYKGIQYLSNIQNLTIGIDAEHPISNDSLAYLG